MQSGTDDIGCPLMSKISGGAIGKDGLNLTDEHPASILKRKAGEIMGQAKRKQETAPIAYIKTLSQSMDALAKCFI